MEKPVQVFCCYARKDQSLLFQLKDDLSLLERSGLIIVQADIDVSPGSAFPGRNIRPTCFIQAS